MNPFDHSDISLQTSINSKIHGNFQDPHKNLESIHWMQYNNLTWYFVTSWYFLRITSNDSFVQKKIDGHVYSVQVHSTRLAQKIFWFISYNSIYVLVRYTYNQYIFGLFEIMDTTYFHHLYQRICNHSDFLQDFLTSLSDSNVGYRLS